MDMRKCIEGDKLLTIHGKVVTYCGSNAGTPYPHLVSFSPSGRGTRTHGGFVFGRSRRLDDEDIVMILPADVARRMEKRAAQMAGVR